MGLAACALSIVTLCAAAIPTVDGPQSGLVGRWHLEGDCRDTSGFGNHGSSRGAEIAADGARFGRRGGHIVVPDSPSLRLGAGDFTLAASTAARAVRGGSTAAARHPTRRPLRSTRSSSTAGASAPAPAPGTGRRPGPARHFAASLRDVRLYRRALSAAEAATLGSPTPGGTVAAR